MLVAVEFERDRDRSLSCPNICVWLRISAHHLLSTYYLFPLTVISVCATRFYGSRAVFLLCVCALLYGGE